MRTAAQLGSGVLAAAVILVGCGSSAESESHSSTERASEDSQRSMQRTIPVRAFGEVVYEGSEGMCYEIPLGPKGESTAADCPPEPSSEADLPAGRFVTALASVTVPGKPPLQGVFLVFESRSGKTCFDVQLLDSSYSGGTPLKCVSTADCRKDCMVTVEDSANRSSHVVGGPVPSSSHAVRVHFADGTSAEYVASGPEIPGLPGFRAFLASLGSKGYASADIR